MSDITFQSIQQVFEQAFLSKRKIPTSITLSESDYNAFCESIFPKQEVSEFERGLLGEDNIAKLEQQRTACQRQRVTHVVNYIDGHMIPVSFSRYLPSGKIFYTWGRVEEIGV